MRKCVFYRKQKDKIHGVVKEYVKCRYDGSMRKESKCNESCPHYVRRTFMWRLFEKNE